MIVPSQYRTKLSTAALRKSVEDHARSSTHCQTQLYAVLVCVNYLTNLTKLAASRNALSQSCTAAAAIAAQTVGI
jgi:hypothetical protein